MANLVVKDSRSDTMDAAAFVYCRSTFCSAMPKYCERGRGVMNQVAVDRGMPQVRTAGGKRQGQPPCDIKLVGV